MIMKKVSILILIMVFLFPLYGHAATGAATQTPQNDGIDITTPLSQGKTLAVKKVAVQAALNDIYDQLTALASQTQTAATQLNSNGIATDDSQAAILAATVSLARAKADIATFTAISVPENRYSSFTFDLMKSTGTAAENNLREAKSHLLDSLTALKASVANI
jgi:hypothetical protein